MKALLLALAAFAAFAPSLAAAQATGDVLIRGGRVVTNTGAPLDKADVLIRGDRIVAVGPGLAAPAGARVIDAAGAWVTPGVFAPATDLGLQEIGGSGAPNDSTVNTTAPVSAAADVARAIDPNVAAIPVQRVDGVTRAAVMPGGRANMFGGRGALIVLDGRQDPVFRARAFQVVEIGETGLLRGGGSRTSMWPMLEAALRDAREYPQRYVSGQGGAVLSEIDAQALKPVAMGEGLLIVRADREADLREAIRFARANPTLRIVIQGASEGWRVASELAAARIPVIVDPFANLPAAFERLGARLDNPRILHAAGVKIAFGGGGSGGNLHQPRLSMQLAGNAVANGLAWDAAFAAITRTPAEIYGAADLGTLAPGKLADVVVWDGDPLEVMSAPKAVLIAGREMSLRSRQSDLADRYNPARRR